MPRLIDRRTARHGVETERGNKQQQTDQKNASFKRSPTLLASSKFLANDRWPHVIRYRSYWLTQSTIGYEAEAL
jgi:hypothetical protein